MNSFKVRSPSKPLAAVLLPCFLLHLSAVACNFATLQSINAFTLSTNTFYAKSTLMIQMDGLMVLGKYSDSSLYLYDTHTSSQHVGLSYLSNTVAFSYIEGSSTIDLFYLLTSDSLCKVSISTGSYTMTPKCITHSWMSSMPVSLLMKSDNYFYVGLETSAKVMLVSQPDWVTFSPTILSNFATPSAPEFIRMGNAFIAIAGNYAKISVIDESLSSGSESTHTLASKMLTLGLSVDPPSHTVFELARLSMSGSTLASYRYSGSLTLLMQIPGPLTSGSEPCAGLQVFNNGNYLFLAASSFIQIYKTSDLSLISIPSPLEILGTYVTNSLSTRAL